MKNKFIYLKPLYLIVKIMVVLLITSCTFNPKYLPKPNPKIPEKWNAKNKQLKQENCKIACIPWWKQFKDPVLEDLINKGLKCNNDIHVAVSNVEAAQGELKRVKYNWLPGLDSLLGYSSFPYLGYPGGVALLIPTYTINIFKQIKEQKKATDELKITKNMRDTVRLAVIAQIAGSYFNYQAQSEKVDLLLAVERDLQKKVDIYSSTYANGLTSDIELVKAKSELELIKSEKMVVLQNKVVSQNMLRYLINENPEKFKFPTRFSSLDPHQELVGALPFNIIENRPDMQQATNELQAANAGIGIAVGSFLPAIQLSAARGDIGIIPYSPKLGTPVYFNQSLLQTSLIRLDKFGELEKSRGIARAYYYRYLDTFRKVLRDINNDLSANELYSERLEHTVLAKNNLSKDYDLHHSLCSEGIISSLSLLEKKTKLDEIKITVNQHKIDQLMTIVTLYQDMAVGYGCT
ncbi:MAG: TolC family protein [Legionellaceae bacterium]|nr:TolC family protein [Legionellaceae bacterium]